MKEWLGARLRALAVPALAVISALAIGALVLMFTDQAGVSVGRPIPTATWRAMFMP